MVIWYNIFNVVFVINLNCFVASLPNIVIVNNKPLSYNVKEDFAEIITVVESGEAENDGIFYGSDNENRKKYEKIDEKSNGIYKTSNFVTNNSFKGGIITKYNFSKNYHGNKNESSGLNRHENSKFFNYFHNPQNTLKKNQTIASHINDNFELKPEIVSAIIYNNDIISNSNSINSTFLSNKHKSTKNKFSMSTKPTRPLKELIIVHTTSSTPTLIAPIIITPPTKKNKTSKVNKKKYNSSSTLIPEPSNIHEHFIQNLDYYRKIFSINCSKALENNATKDLTVVDNDTIEVTPKPTIVDKHKDKDKEDKDKKKCKKHHGHHHHHHHGHKDSHEDKPSYDYKLSSHAEQKPLESHKVSSIPTRYSHHHQHEHQIHPINRVSTPLNPIPDIPNKVNYFDAPPKLPPLGEEYEEVGSMFETFYRAIENAFTTTNRDDQESVDYDSKDYENEESVSVSDYSENESEEGGGENDDDDDDDENYSEDYKKKRKKRDILPRRKKSSESKALKTKIVITNEYDDLQQQQHQQNVTNQTKLSFVGKKKKVKNNNRKSSEEYSIFDSIISFDSYSDEYDYDENLSLSKKHSNGSKKVMKKQQTDDSPANFFSDELHSMFSYIRDMFQIFSYEDVGDQNNIRRKDGWRKKKASNYYNGETYLKTIETTTEKPESHFKRPKRENEKLPWYFPSFLSHTHNDMGFNEHLSSSFKKWHLPWNNEKHSYVKEAVDNADATETTTTLATSDDMYETTARVMPYDLFGMLTKLMTSKNDEQTKNFKSSKKVRKKSYNDYQLWRLFPMSSDDVAYLNEFRFSKKGMKIHWLKAPHAKDSTDAVIPPKYIDHFKDFLSEGEIKYIVKIRNIQHAINYENPRLNKRDQIELELINGHPLTWYRYHNSRDIQTYYDYLKRKYPAFIELIQIGWSFNGKPLTVVKISYPKQTSYDVKKPAIFILSGTSAHIWLPIACSTYILNSLVTNIANDDSYGKMIRKFDWYILSVLNPDGYDYSMTSDRLWQKSRSQQFLSRDSFISSALNWFRSSNANETEKICYGVDMTRNFDSNWIEDESTGDNKCTDYYKGSHASSEPEIKLLSNFLLKHNKSIKLFINLDGYGQQLLFPSSKLKQGGIDDLNDMARSGLRNVKMHRNGDRKYDINSRNIDMSSGTVESFAMNKAKIKYSYRIESIDNRQYSIFVPATAIEQNANEILDIVKGMVKYLENE